MITLISLTLLPVETVFEKLNGNQCDCFAVRSVRKFATR